MRQEGSPTLFDVTVYLDPAAFGLPGPAMKAADFEVEAGSVDEALDIAWAVCNSAPGELFCPARYADVVSEYREARHRSLSVGDLVRVRGDSADFTFRCDEFGWSPADSPATPEAPRRGDDARGTSQP